MSGVDNLTAISYDAGVGGSLNVTLESSYDLGAGGATESCRTFSVDFLSLLT